MDDASMCGVVLAWYRRPIRLTQVRLFLAFALLLVPLSLRAEGRRVALVIGNGAYQYMPVLANPVADAHAVATTLQQLGFQVERKENLDLHALREAFRRFGEQARGAEVALVYFAGHGMQAVQQDQAENYLLPVDARLQDVDDIDDQAVPLTRLLALLRDTQIRVVLLDSCRDNPVVARLSGQGTRGMARSGLAPVPEQEARGALIGFAAAPGEQAKDGTGQHSPYAAALLQHLAQPGLEVDLMLRQVAADVEDATDGRQIPEHWNRLRGREGLYLAGPLPLGLTAPAPTPPVTPAMVPVRPMPVDRPVSPPALESDCDQLAKPPRNEMGSMLPHYPVPHFPGVNLGNINVSAAREACQHAMAAYPGDPRFATWLGRVAVQTGNNDEALRLFRLAAEQSDPSGQFYLGHAYTIGRGVQRDFAEAVRLYRLAAGQGYARAQSMLGLMHKRGLGVKQDYDEAARFCRLAVAQGDPLAQFLLATLYEMGLGVQQNDAEAVRLSRLSAYQGYPLAQVQLGAMYDDGRGVKRNPAEALAWYRKAAAQGNMETQNALRYLSDGAIRAGAAPKLDELDALGLD